MMSSSNVAPAAGPAAPAPKDTRDVLLAELFSVAAAARRFARARAASTRPGYDSEQQVEALIAAVESYEEALFKAGEERISARGPGAVGAVVFRCESRTADGLRCGRQYGHEGHHAAE